MQKEPLVSILICTYNAEKTIVQTLQSCLNQTYNNIEILIHDDQSSDNTIKIIESLGENKITIIHSGKKLGPYGGLNFLLDHATGDYIAIQDHDDLWHPEKIQKQIEFLESKNGQQYIGCGTTTLMRYESDQKGFEYFLGKENYYTIHPSLVFRNEKTYRYPTDSVYMNDALFQKMVLCQGKKRIHNLDETLTFHRIKDGASNFSYKWFSYTTGTIRTVFTLHPIWYAICVIGWETMRKLVYPILHTIRKGQWIDIIERKPFELMGNRITSYKRGRLKEMQFLKDILSLH